MATTVSHDFIKPITTKVKVKVKSLSRVRLFATPWSVAYQAPLSMGFFQAIVLEWIAISFSRRSSQPRDRTTVSRIVDRRFTVWALSQQKGMDIPTELEHSRIVPWD